MSINDDPSSSMAVIGSSNAFDGNILFPEYDDDLNNNLLEFEQCVAGSATATSTNGADVEHPSKIWRIHRATAERMINNTPQRCVWSSGDNGLSQFGKSTTG